MHQGVDISILALSAVLLLIAVRQVGKFSLQIWQIMLLGAIAVLFTGEISPAQAAQAINLDVNDISCRNVRGRPVHAGERLSTSSLLSHLSQSRELGSAFASDIIWYGRPLGPSHERYTGHHRHPADDLLCQDTGDLSEAAALIAGIRRDHWKRREPYRKSAKPPHRHQRRSYQSFSDLLPIPTTADDGQSAARIFLAQVLLQEPVQEWATADPPGKDRRSESGSLIQDILRSAHIN